jgi:hypothetical protein
MIPREFLLGDLTPNSANLRQAAAREPRDCAPVPIEDRWRGVGDRV